MQIKLFPDETPSSEAQTALQRGRIGPVCFAATPMSYPHLCQALEALIPHPPETTTEMGTQD